MNMIMNLWVKCQLLRSLPYEVILLGLKNSFAIQCLVLLLHIWEVPCANVNLQDGHPD